MTFHPRLTRRAFLSASSATLAGVTLSARSLNARSLSATDQLRIHTLSRSLDVADLQRLASAAIDAARQAGATYADARIAERHILEVRQNPDNPLVPNLRLDVLFAYGIRVCLNGVWTFTHGSLPDLDAITAAARDAVSSARGIARVVTAPSRPTELAPTPVVTGVWASPVSIDPFTVAIEDQMAVLDACRQAAERLPGGSASGAFTWIRETRSFASTEGSLTTQTVYRAKPTVTVVGERGMHGVSIRVPLAATTGGYETVLVPTLQEQVKTLTEDAVQLSRLPRRPLEIGRYPVVFDGPTVGAVFGATLGQALELDRVLGDESDASGTSILAPITDVVGNPLFSPLLHVTAGRVLPALHAVRWDDDGVEPHEYTVITQGQVVDYHTSRQTASALAAWYARQGQPLRSHGCALAQEADNPVLVRAPHSIVAHGTESATIEALCKDIQRGVLVQQGDISARLSTDHQCATGNLQSLQMFEIERGRIVRRVRGAMLQFSTKILWKSLMALGDASTVRTTYAWASKGQPWIMTEQSTTAPAGLFKDVQFTAGGWDV